MRTRAIRSAAALAASAVVVGVALAGCTPIVALDPAPDAASPLCAAVSVRLPDEVDGLPARETNAQATGAWGNPTAVVLHCGVASPPPTSELPCVTPPGGAVDWLVDDSDAPTYVFTSYGRTPAVSVAIDNTVVSGVSVLDAIDVAVSQLPRSGSCL
ncbi:MAG: hypothetical protein BGO95_05180 [Micrococcales bacterium 73-13]|nr:MAG: hypothetical protein BGO95_05180 [Micrococcales bacterium 73-13]